MYGTIDEWALPTTSAAVDIAVDTPGLSSYPPGSLWVVWGAERIGERAGLGILRIDEGVMRVWTLGAITRYGQTFAPTSLHLDERGRPVFIFHATEDGASSQALCRFRPDRGVMERWLLGGRLESVTSDPAGRLWVTNHDGPRLDCIEPDEGRLLRWWLPDLTSLGPGRLLWHRGRLFFTGNRAGKEGLPEPLLHAFEPASGVLTSWPLSPRGPCRVVSADEQMGHVWLLCEPALGRVGCFDSAASNLFVHPIPGAGPITALTAIYQGMLCLSDAARGELHLAELPATASPEPLDEPKQQAVEPEEAAITGPSVHRTELRAQRCSLMRTRLHVTAREDGARHTFAVPGRRPVHLTFSPVDDSVLFTERSPSRIGRLLVERPLTVWASLLQQHA